MFVSLSETLLNLINTSLETWILPNDMKISTIIPVPKVRNSSKACDLRSINMLYAVEKYSKRMCMSNLLVALVRTE